MSVSDQVFTIGSTIELSTIFEINLIAEVMAYDPKTRLLALSEYTFYY